MHHVPSLFLRSLENLKIDWNALKEKGGETSARYYNHEE